jgi:hypothetical protein
MRNGHSGQLIAVHRATSLAAPQQQSMHLDRLKHRYRLRQRRQLITRNAARITALGPAIGMTDNELLILARPRLSTFGKRHLRIAGNYRRT